MWSTSSQNEDGLEGFTEIFIPVLISNKCLKFLEEVCSIGSSAEGISSTVLEQDDTAVNEANISRVSEDEKGLSGENGSSTVSPVEGAAASSRTAEVPVVDLNSAAEYIIKSVQSSCLGCTFSDDLFYHSCKDITADELVNRHFENVCRDLGFVFSSEIDYLNFKSLLEGHLSNLHFCFM